MRKIGYSTSGFKDRDVESAMDTIAAIGFTHVEILGQEPHVAVIPKGKKLSNFRKRLESLNLSVSVHAPLKRNVLGAADEIWRREKVKILSNYICFAGEIGADAIIIHPVPNPIFVPEPKDSILPQHMRDSAYRSLDELVPIAQKAKLCILLENLPYLCNYPLLTMKELRPFVDLYPQEYVGLVIDIGHTRVHGDDIVEEIRIAGDRLYGTHLHDTDKEGTNDYHWVPTHGSLNWDIIRSTLTEVKYTGVWTFEVNNGRFGESPEELACICHRLAVSW